MNYYDEIKNELINNEINRRVKNYLINRSDLNTYFNVGRMLNEAGKHYGEGIVKEYSKKLKNELSKNYSVRLLYRMLRYYKFVSAEKLPTLSAKLSWSHYDEILKAGKHYGEGIIKEYSKRLEVDLNVKYDVSSLNKMRKFYNLSEIMATLSPNLSYSHYVELLSYDDINKITYYIKICEQHNLSVRKLREKIRAKEYERLPLETKNKLVAREESSVTLIFYFIILSSSVMLL